MIQTVENVKQKIREAVEKATGWPTIFSPANGPQPSNQYCVVTLKDIETFEMDVIKIEDIDDNLVEKQRQESKLTFDVQARGTGSMEKLHDFVAYLDSVERDIDLWDGIGSGGHDSIQNINTYQNGKILPVSVVNVYVHTALKKENIIQYMNVLDISVKISNNETITTTVPTEEES